MNPSAARIPVISTHLYVIAYQEVTQSIIPTHCLWVGISDVPIRNCCNDEVSNDAMRQIDESMLEQVIKGV